MTQTIITRIGGTPTVRRGKITNYSGGVLRSVSNMQELMQQVVELASDRITFDPRNEIDLDGVHVTAGVHYDGWQDLRINELEVCA